MCYLCLCKFAFFLDTSYKWHQTIHSIYVWFLSLSVMFLRPITLQHMSVVDPFPLLSSIPLSDSLWPHGLYSPWNSPGQNTGVGSLSLLQVIVPTQGPNPGLPHCRCILHQLSHKGSPVWSPFTLLWALDCFQLHSFMFTIKLVPNNHHEAKTQRVSTFENFRYF